MSARRFVLGGRAFVEILESTFLHDASAIALLYRAGLEGMRPRPGETAEEFGTRVTVRVIESGTLTEILGSLLVPEGTPDIEWTPETAKATAAHLGAIVEPDEKRALWGVTAEVLFPFLGDALAWLPSSRSSSPTETDSADPVPPTPSAPGATSSAPSPASTIPITGW